MIKGLEFLSTLIGQKVNSETHAGHCVACLDPRARDGLCTGCRTDLPYNRWHCRQCALPLAIPSALMTCGECLAAPPPYSHTAAPWRYQFPVDAMITRYKYNGQRKFVRPLMAGLTDDLAQRHQDRPELLIPAPMHGRRRRVRGFNQAEDIAEHLSRHLDIPWNPRLIRRVRNVRPQRELGREERLANLQGVFTVTGHVSGRVAVVDDVITTGATVRALAQVLLDAGASDVQVWALARTPG